MNLLANSQTIDDGEWSLDRCLIETVPFGDAVGAVLPIVIGILGEWGEAMEEEDDTSLSLYGVPPGCRKTYRKELADVLVYLTLYVKHVNCGWGCESHHPLDRTQRCIGYPSGKDHIVLGREFTKAACRLLEYEKKINRGTYSREKKKTQKLVFDCLYRLIQLANCHEINLGQEFKLVTEDNRRRNEQGDFDKSGTS